MLKLRKVAITGGLSCGKSSVCLILKELGAYVVSADKIVHQLLTSDANLGKEIVRLLGHSVYVNQTLDRSRIAQIVFQDPKLLKALEELVHPTVYREINKDYQKQQNQLHPPPIFIAEIPLLFESGGEKDFDSVIAVVADEEVCCQRFQQATGFDQMEFNQRMARQMSNLDKAKYADYVIVNNGSYDDLRQATKTIYQEIINK